MVAAKGYTFICLAQHLAHSECSINITLLPSSASFQVHPESPFLGEAPHRPALQGPS